MKQRTIKFTMFCVIALTLQVSNAQKNHLSQFETLMGQIWKAEGKWGDGSKFKQEIIFTYALDSTIVIAKSKGYTNKEQTKYGLRNHGIRQYDRSTNSVLFWEFDVFGGCTSGEIKIENSNFYYNYEYGDTLITDAWEKIDNSSYKFTVGIRQNNTWNQKFIETKFISKPFPTNM